MATKSFTNKQKMTKRGAISLLEALDKPSKKQISKRSPNQVTVLRKANEQELSRFVGRLFS